MIKYLNATNLMDLQKEVESQLGLGFCLYGPVVVDSNEDGTQYIQTMAKPGYTL